MRLICLCLLSITCFQASGQALPFERYTTKNGLVSDRITTISQDSKGFMWFGSFFGISRYDGTKFEKIPLAEIQQNKYVIFLEPAGDKMYAGFLFNGGLMEYDKGVAHAYFIEGKDAQGSNEFSCMTALEDGSILVCNTASQLFRFAHGKFSFVYQLPYRSQLYPRAIQEDSYHNFWIATEKGIYILSAGMTRLKMFYPEESIYSLQAYEDGRMLVTRTDGEKSVTSVFSGSINGGTGREIKLHEENGIKPVMYAGNISDGQWEISYARGLTHYKTNGRRESFHTPLDLGNDIFILYNDRESNLWIANEPGVVKIPALNIYHYRFNETAIGGAYMTHTPDSVVWVANGRGLYSIEKNAIIARHTEVPMNEFYGQLLCDREGYTWISFWNGGLMRTKWVQGRLKEKRSYTRFGDTKIEVHDLYQDSHGNVWAGGIFGLFRINNGEVVDHFRPLNKNGSPTFITSLTVDEGTHTIWAGDNAEGVVAIHYEPGEKYRYEVNDYIGEEEGLSDRYIRSIYFDDHRNLWIGTRSGGIFRKRRGGKKITSSNQNASLGCSRISRITGGNNSTVLFASCDGVYRYSNREDNWTHYNTSNGILNAEVYTVYQDSSDGRLWAVTSEGVSVLKPDAAQKQVLPLVSITSVSIMGKADSLALLHGMHRYSYTSNSIGFSFAGASFLDEKRLLYRYMLEGYDKTWGEPVSSPTVNYVSLPPGKYVFRVKAANSRGQWSAASADYPFEIVMPFYRRPVFFFFVFTVLVFILYMIRFQQLKQRYRIEKLRFHIARDLHDDIGSTLGSINILSQTARRRLDKQLPAEEISPIFHTIGKSAENTLEAMDDIVWSINPGKDKVEDLLIRIREFAIPLLEGKGLDFQISFEGNDHEPLPMDLRRNVFLICKEAVYNVLRHSEASHVQVLLKRSHHHLILKVEDNGSGFDVHAASSRNGLKNMQNRAALVNGVLTIHSSEAGTRILFEAPIK